MREGISETFPFDLRAAARIGEDLSAPCLREGVGLQIHRLHQGRDTRIPNLHDNPRRLQTPQTPQTPLTPLTPLNA